MGGVRCPPQSQLRLRKSSSRPVVKNAFLHAVWLEYEGCNGLSQPCSSTAFCCSLMVRICFLQPGLGGPRSVPKCNLLADFCDLHSFHHGVTSRRGEKAFAPVANPGRMMPRATAPIAPQEAWRIPQTSSPGRQGLGLEFRIAFSW